jgi:hypothetical protein
LAVYSPPRTKVLPLSAYEADRLDGKIPPPRRPGPRQPLTTEKSETQLTREFVAELDGRVPAQTAVLLLETDLIAGLPR